MINFRYGPDGAVHAIDWYDKNQCHSSNPDVHQKTLGRIFKISHDERSVRPRRSREDAVGRARRAAAQPQRLVRPARAAHPAGARTRPDGARAAQTHAARASRRHAQAARDLGAARHRRVDASRTCSRCSPRQRVRPQLGGLPAGRRQAVRRTSRCGSSRRSRARTPRRSSGCIWRARCSACRSSEALGRRWRRSPPHGEDAARSEPAADGLVRGRTAGGASTWPARSTLAVESKLPRLFSFTVQRIAAVGTQDALRVADRSAGPHRGCGAADGSSPTASIRSSRSTDTLLAPRVSATGASSRTTSTSAWTTRTPAPTARRRASGRTRPTRGTARPHARQAARVPARVSALAVAASLRRRPASSCSRSSTAGLEMVEPLFMRFIIDRVLLERRARSRRAADAGCTSPARLFVAVVVALEAASTSLKDYRQRLLNTQRDAVAAAVAVRPAAAPAAAEAVGHEDRRHPVAPHRRRRHDDRPAADGDRVAVDLGHPADHRGRRADAR